LGLVISDINIVGTTYNPVISGNDIHDNYYVGILVNDTIGGPLNRFTIGPNNNLYDNSWYEPTPNPLDTDGGGWGIWIENSLYMVLDQNNITTNGRAPGIGENIWGAGIGIFNRANNIVVQNNYVNGNEEYSIISENTRRINLLSNEFTASTGSLFSTIIGLTVSNNEFGSSIGNLFENIANITVNNNEFNGSETITFYFIANLTISNNYFCNSISDPINSYLFINTVWDAVLDNNVISDNAGGGALLRYSQCNITNNRIEDNGDGGIGAQFGSYNLSISNNEINGNADMGLHVVGRNIKIFNNNITNNGDGLYYNPLSPDLRDCGIDLINSSNIHVYNNYIANNSAPVGGLPMESSGIFLYNSDDIVIEDNILFENQYNIHGWSNCRNVTVVNCTLTELVTPLISTYDVALQDNGAGPSFITFLNTTFDDASVLVSDAQSELTVKWYLGIQVRQGGIGRNGASVWTNDTFGQPDPPTGQPFTTTTAAEDATDGWVKWIPVTEYKESSTGSIDSTPQKINVSWTDYEGLASPIIRQSQNIVIDLNWKPEGIDVAPVGYFGTVVDVYRTFIINITANGTDSEDYEEAFTEAIFEYRDPNDLYWNNTYLGTAEYVDTDSNPNNDIGYYMISFTAPADAILGTYDLRVRFKDTYGSYSDWIYLDDKLNVLNNPPYGEDMYNQTTSPGAPEDSLFRGDFSWIYGDGEDIEDGDDQNFEVTGVRFEYKRPLTGEVWNYSTSYWFPPTPSKDNNDWRQKFLPQDSPDIPTGVYNFRVQFQDKDGNWSEWIEMGDLTVLNNQPVLDNFKKETGVVLYRENEIRIFANFTDREEAEDLLEVWFYYRNSTATVWDDSWFDGGNGKAKWDNDPNDKFFWQDFQPPATADLGNYEFMVRVRDHEYQSNWAAWLDKENQTLYIEVKNNLPIAESIHSSEPVVRATGTEFIYIHVNASQDDEDLEKDMTLLVEYDDGDGYWKTDYIGTTTTWDDFGDYLKIKFQPIKASEGAKLGDYYFRAKVRDKDGDLSTNYIYLSTPVNVQNPIPTLEDISLGATAVYRGETLYLFVNASDKVDNEGDLIMLIEYNREGTGWVDVPESWISYDDTNFNPNDNEGHWVIAFATDESTQLGEYKFRGTVKNSAQGLSNNGVPTYPTPDTAEIMNNPPEAIDLSADGSTVERGDTITLYAKVDDFEDNPRLVEPSFEWSIGGGSPKTTGFSNKVAPSAGGNTWTIDFKPPDDADLGSYDFTVYFEDKDGGISAPLKETGLLEVTNALPEVTSLIIPKPEGYRLEELRITADGMDVEDDEGDLEPIFQYKGPTGDWIGYGQSGSYFSNAADYDGSRWYIIFKPLEDAEKGKYSFRVKFKDKNDGESLDWWEENDAYDLQNSDPEVEIESNPPIDGKTVEFSATGTDVEGDADLAWFWDFGDGETSNEESPSHTYDSAGDYTVEVTVTDSDEATATDTLDIKIEGEAEGGFSMLLLVLLLVIVVVVVLLVVLMLTRKKKKPEEIPPAVPGVAPGVPGAPPAAMAPGPPPAVPPGVPAAPAAIPAAVPAAPPAAPAGQQIKCPKCGTGFTVESTERPITIQCPNCGAQGKLT
jgi:parallel beta-helix repeat protein